MNSSLSNVPFLLALQSATPAQAEHLMRPALAALVAFQRDVPLTGLPVCDAALLARDLALFPEWCVAREFGLLWSEREQQVWRQAAQALMAVALAQPVVAVHANWDACELLLPEGAPPVVSGLQAALAGPITWDLAELLRHPDIDADEPQEIDGAVRYWQAARAAGLPVDADFGEFWRALEWTGLLCHLQRIGVCCQLKHTTAQADALRQLPRLFGQVNKVALRYGPLKPLLRLIEPMSGLVVSEGYTF